MHEVDDKGVLSLTICPFRMDAHADQLMSMLIDVFLCRVT